MSRYHWAIGGGGSGTWSGSSSFGSHSPGVPAGATLKRVLVVNNAWRGRGQTTTEPPPDQLSLNQTLSLSGGWYGSRDIYTTSRLFRYEGFGVYNVNALRTTYSALYGAGDDEVGINHECNYGGPGKNVGTLTYTWILVSGGASVPPGTAGNWQYNVRFLYYL
jgi:hypothetical protein